MKKTTTSASATSDTTPTAPAVAAPVTDAAPVGTAIATIGETALEEFDFGDFAGAGMKDLPSSLIKVPYLGILSKNRKYITDPKLPDKSPNPLFGHIGDFLHPVTGRVYSGERGFVGVLVSVGECYVERSPKPENKFKGKHMPESQFVKDGIAKTKAANRAKKDSVPFGTTLTPDESGNELFQTYEALMVLTPIGENGEPTDEKLTVFVSFKKTSIPDFANYTTAVRGNRTLPNGREVPANTISLFANEFIMTSASREAGSNSWHIPVLRPRHGDVSKSVSTKGLFVDACEVFKIFSEGRMTSDDTTMDAAGDDGHEGGSTQAAPNPNFNY